MPVGSSLASVAAAVAFAFLAGGCERADERAARRIAQQTATERAAIEADDRALQGPAPGGFLPGGPGGAAPPAAGPAPGLPAAIADVAEQVHGLTRGAGGAAHSARLARQAILGDADLRGSVQDFDVAAEGSVVVLYGWVRSQSEPVAAADAVRAAVGASRVDNRIRIRGE